MSETKHEGERNLKEIVPTIRLSPSNEVVLEQLGCLKELAGNWEGHGFNLIGRPDFQALPLTGAGQNVFVQLSETKETLKFDPISTAIPNRGDFQRDIELHGLTYLQKISDKNTGGALHIEPGIWINIPPTTAPQEGQMVARMASIPHGNALLAQGSCKTFKGAPVISPGPDPLSGGHPAFSIFPSFNSTPFILTPPPGGAPGAPPAIRAAGTSEAASAPGGGFPGYTLVPTPPPQTQSVPLPPGIKQSHVNDPILYLQEFIEHQLKEGYEFEGTVLNIATKRSIDFLTVVNQTAALPAPQVITVPEAGGDIGNIPFLKQNATTVLTYATFWITKVTQKNPGHELYKKPFWQLQYAQMVVLNFPATQLPSPPFPKGNPPLTGEAPFSWPHVSVATLKKTFG